MQWFETKRKRKTHYKCARDNKYYIFSSERKQTLEVWNLYSRKISWAGDMSFSFHTLAVCLRRRLWWRSASVWGCSTFWLFCTRSLKCNTWHFSSTGCAFFLFFNLNVTELYVQGSGNKTWLLGFDVKLEFLLHFHPPFKDFHPFLKFQSPGTESRLFLHTGGRQRWGGAQSEDSAIRKIWVQIPHPPLIWCQDSFPHVKSMRDNDPHLSDCCVD